MLITAICALLIVALAACGGDDSDDASPTPQPTLARTTTTATQPARTATGATVELIGIVGAVNAATRTIEVDRTGGADVTRVEIGPETRIEKADDGSRLTLNAIRPSDRIIASGRLTEAGDALLADEISIGQVVSSGSPGG